MIGWKSPSHWIIKEDFKPKILKFQILSCFNTVSPLSSSCLNEALRAGDVSVGLKERIRVTGREQGSRSGKVPLRHSWKHSSHPGSIPWTPRFSFLASFNFCMVWAPWGGWFMLHVWSQNCSCFLQGSLLRLVLTRTRICAYRMCPPQLPMHGLHSSLADPASTEPAAPRLFLVLPWTWSCHKLPHLTASAFAIPSARNTLYSSMHVSSSFPF